MEGHRSGFGNVAGKDTGSLVGGLENVHEPAFGGHAGVPAMRSALRKACAPIDVPCCERSPWVCVLNEADGAALVGGEGNRIACAGFGGGPSGAEGRSGGACV